MSQSHHIIHLWSLKLLSARLSLTNHSAEVNIGIVAACLPTLLPLYRLLRDKIIALRNNPTSTTGRFLRFSFGQSHKQTILSLHAVREFQRGDEIAIPQNAQRVNSTHAFARIGNAGDEDVEMQTRFLESR